MKEEYNRYFERIVSLKSDEELYRAVLNSGKADFIMDNNMDNNKKNTKKRGVKMIVAPLAAVIAAVGMTVGAFAVYNRNVNQELNNILAEDEDRVLREHKDASGAVVDPEDVKFNGDLYDKLNITIGAVYDELDGVRIEIPGAICDGKDMLVLYDVIVDEEYEALCESNQRIFLQSLCLPKEYHEGARSSRGSWSTRDGKKVYTAYSSITGVNNCKDDKLTVKFDNLSTSRDNDGVFADKDNIDFEVDIPLTNDFSKVNRTFTANNAQSIDLNNWGKWEVTAAEVSALTLRVDIKADGAALEGNIFKTTLGAVFPIEVTFKDGSKLEMDDRAVSGYDYNTDAQTGYFYVPLNLPIDVDDVQSVQFASAVINEDGTATTVEIPEVVDRYTRDEDDKK